MRHEDVGPEEIRMLEPRLFEREVAANLAWRIDPPGHAMFDTGEVLGAAPGARSVMFSTPGVYTLQGHSAFPLSVLSNTITIRVE